METYNDNQGGESLAEEPLEIKVFYPEDVILIDSRKLKRRRRRPSGPRPRPFLALGLFIATCLSTFLTGLVFFSTQEIDLALPSFTEIDIQNGLKYSISIISILLFHEMGHYLQSKRYGIPASYPYFIPMPLNPFGTMGAVILQGSGVANRKSLFDVAITGPLAGLVIALPCVFWGVAHSEVIEIGSSSNSFIFGNPILIQWIAEWYHGPIPDDFMLEMNPILFAGWVGIFITALNLIPIGQLDGGHVLYTLIGKRAHQVAKLMLYGAVAMMIIKQKPTYMLMVFLLYMMGTNHPPTEDDSVPLGRVRILLGWITLAFIFVGFTSDPLLDPTKYNEENVEQSGEPKLVHVLDDEIDPTDSSKKETVFKPLILQEEWIENLVSPDEPDRSYLLLFPNR